LIQCRKELSGEKGRNERDLCQRIYNAHQILNKQANYIFSGVVEFSIYTTAMLLIFCVYIFLRFTEHFLIQNIVCWIGITCFCCLKYALKLATSCHINSEEAIGQGGRISQQKPIERRFWKGRMPISIQVGEQFQLKTMNYVLNFFGIIIIDNVISLLLAF